MQYVYLNEYSKGYLYVGSHKWDGEGIDPDYHGSSSVAQHYGWAPVKETILEIVTDARQRVAERYWIELYAERYKIADCASLLAHNGKSPLINRFGKHGRLLNLHCNDLYVAHSAVVQRKAESLGISVDEYVASRRDIVSAEKRGNSRKYRAENRDTLIGKQRDYYYEHKSQELSRRARNYARDKMFAEYLGVNMHGLKKSQYKDEYLKFKSLHPDLFPRGK